ncbi:sensor histidine kinase YpdA [Kordia sp. SMS9]|uniref:sensor histidine kinase n=1 Tax=Kordia sp. SMS9 TaxID=2282170 RepID=UPI000E0CE935|nr:histidine kinase [Kordia sp. SMS9]AXG68402.1 sensor histidine kinase YpdA [Kordia sp. SMS9]
MKLWNKINQYVSKQDLVLFLSFYVFSTIMYYTASWISWGGFKKGHPSYFDVEEFFASGGAQFLISFFVTIPIWYITSVVLRKYKLRVQLLSHILFLPLYIAICYYSLLGVTKIFGWAMYWGGYKVIWTLYSFMLFYFVQFGFIHAYGYFKRFKKEEKEKAILRETTLKSEITALKSQLNPHFLHNLFNSINATIPKENERTRELIIQLSDLFRYQNYASQNEFVTIKEEIDFIQSYLELMQIRLKERLNFAFKVEKEVYHHKIVPMLLQPLVENAVNHGIATKITPSTLRITIEKQNDRLHISIEDTGIGIINKESVFLTGLGLSNTKMRLDKIYNSELKIEDNVPTGTKISFTI